MDSAFNCVTALGPSPAVDEFLVASAELSKAIDRAYRAKASLRRFATEAGMDQNAFNALCAGEYATVKA